MPFLADRLVRPWHPYRVNGGKAGAVGLGTALIVTVGVVVHGCTAPVHSTMPSFPGNSVHGSGPVIGDCVTLDSSGQLEAVVVCSQPHYGTVLATPAFRGGTCPTGTTLSRRSEDGTRLICIGPDRLYAGR